MRRRLTTVVGGTLTILALTASSAFAHVCINASRSDTGNAAARANSQVFITVDELIELLPVFIPELCDDAVVYLHDWAAGAGVSDKLIHTKVTMASGTEGTSLSSDGLGIDHLPDSALFEAFAQCAA